MNSVAFIRGLGPLILCAMAMMSAATQSLGQNASFTTQAYSLIGNTHVAADFNGDGKLDLAGSGANAVSVMINSGNGTFGPKTDFPVGIQTQDVAAGDFNSDGRMDLVVTLNSPQTSLALLLGTGTGSFSSPTFFPNTSGFDSPAVVATDLNNDGRLDVVIMHSIACFTAPCRSARNVTVLLGNGDGTFQPAREIDVNTFPHSIGIGDFNRDGIKDLAVGGENTELSILLGFGNGTFVLQPVMLLVPGGDLFSACNDVDVADFNQDNLPDIVVPLGNGNGNAIALGNGDGTFRLGTRFLEDAVSSPQSDAVGDFNRDGLIDVARGMGDGTRGLIQVMHGNGDGTFRPVVHYATPAPNSSVGGGHIIAADFNGDTKPDLAVQVRGANPATDVLLNTTGAATSPSGATISALTLSPSTVTGGSASTGTVTLNTRVSTSTPVQLTSNSAAATVPASVTVPANGTSASFTISTKQVSSATSAQITATANGSSRVATLTINATASTADTISITRAEYERSKTNLRVEATSTRSTATLKVFVTSTGQLIGTLANNGGGKFGGQFSWSTNPQNITVRSNFGGSKSATVVLK
ncbi:MAG TPA: FG-GAP-like repeat-containing protein [Chthoniobacterales bacterium]|nr:FG-GAP-like repeat-containing protein [Chthoniobacterales bacterium]